MWIFLSRKLRLWVLLGVALPLARFLVHRLALTAHKRNADATVTRALDKTDSTLTSLSARGRTYRKG